MYKNIALGPHTCSGGSSQWVKLTHRGNLSVLSVGFRNEGFAQLLHASQLFVNDDHALWQVMNLALTSTTWWPTLVVDQAGVADIEGIVARQPIEVGEEPIPSGERRPG
ncbi:hypothetical protein ABZ806_34995 [Spirillospora sp. NPDC047418]